MHSALIHAAQAVLSGGRSTSRFTARERTELSLVVSAIERDTPTPLARAQRGEAAVGLFGNSGTFETEAAATVTDIMHAARLRGVDPFEMLAAASETYTMREMGWNRD